jgi:carboxyl-terminal processing protease
MKDNDNSDRKSLLFLCLLWILAFYARPSFSQEISPQNNPGAITKIKLKIFDQAWIKVNEHYFDPNFNGVNWARMKEIYRPQAKQAENIDALLDVINRMLAELKTSHLHVKSTPVRDYKALKRKLGKPLKQNEDVFLWGGLVYALIEEKWIVVAVDAGSPAEHAGVKRGWIWTTFNNVPVGDKHPTLSDDGKADSYSFRDDRNEEVNLLFAPKILITPQHPKADWKILEGNIGYIKIQQFISGIGDWVKQSMSNFQAAKVNSVIIDLRGNSGGLIEETKKSLSPFFKQDTGFGTFVDRKNARKKEIIKGQGEKTFTGNVILLADEGSFSAAEMYCSVISENGRGQIIGRKTAGEVLNSNEFQLSKNIMLLVPTRDYRTSKGARLEGSGIMADIEISRTTIEDIRAGRDRILEKAMEILGKDSKPN